MTFVESLLTSFLLSGLWLVLIGFLGRSLLTNLLAKDVEAFKGRIAVQNIEKQIVLTRLHEKRAEAISAIYQGLLEYHAKCRSLVFTAEHVEESERQELLNEVSNASASFRTTFQTNHLYLRASLCDKIESIFREAQMPAHQFIFTLGQYIHTNAISEEQYAEEWKKAFEVFADKLPPLLKELEGEFRSLLGVEA